LETAVEELTVGWRSKIERWKKLGSRDSRVSEQVRGREATRLNVVNRGDGRSS
jgi:hypothetical protein